MMGSSYLRLVLYLVLSMASLGDCLGNEDWSVQLNDDVLGLIVFKSDLHDPSSYLDSWSEDDNSPCSWPSIICNPSTGRVSEVVLDGLGLSGKIGRGLQKLQHLKVLSLANNNFSGDLSPDISLISSLRSLNLSRNGFSGHIESSFVNTNSIRFVDLSENSLSGRVPDSLFASCSSLRYLSLAGNMLEGPIPGTLSRCSLLNGLNLSNNHFSGSPDFRTGFWSFTRLRTLDLSSNALSGSVPTGVSAIHNLRELKIQSNQFSGSLPADIGWCPHLRVLDFSDNLFTASLPWSLQRLNSLTSLRLSNNLLSCDFPQWIGNMSSLETIDFSNNSFNGSISEEIGKCSSLEWLSLSHNALSGSIPESISNLTMLKILQLEFNALRGEIPQELGRLENLVAVNISYNKLTGRLPVGGIFPSLDQSSVLGNSGICSPLLKGPCKMNVPKPLVLDPNAYPNQMGSGHSEESSQSNNSEHRMFLSVSAIIAILAAMLIAVGVVIISLLNISARRSLMFVENAMESMCSSSSTSGCSAEGKMVLFDSGSSPDLVTNPESLLNKGYEIGGGVFGTVYKVPLGAQGRVVAIKKLVTSNMIEDFDREVRILGRAKHTNLVSLKGYYWSPQTQLLVTDYAPNGSLQSKLHERLPSSPPLSWASRFKIVLGTAKGLAYLHHSSSPPIVHYNIKPSNILLDEDHNPMISDFGLARLLTDHVMGNGFKTALGYVAPELACQSLRVNDKCDIYGFGVLMLELVTGRRSVEYGEDNVMILSDHVKVLMEQGNVLECVDPSMSEYPEDEVLPVLKLAMVCTGRIPSTRPSMAQVVQILQLINT